jgi:hypothetical protein
MPYNGTMRAIQLNTRRWMIDETKPLGNPGGFGAVFLGQDESGGEVAIKRLAISANEAAHRELSIAQHLAGKPLRYVIPVHDSGLDPDSERYFVVMARATQSLQDTIKATGPMGEEAAARVLLDILRGLAEVSDIVHRDLKPANVLWHEDRWKVADFGIARFIEETTSLRTLKDCLTPSYGAPEQWQTMRASSVTDIYALGCIGYALLTGAPPFSGSAEELRRQHLEAQPADLPEVHPRLRSALTMMLRKASEARPTRERAMKLLEDFLADKEKAKLSSGGFSTLAHAGAIEAARQAAEESQTERLRAELQRRERLAREALVTLTETAEQVLAAVERDAPSATIERPGQGNGRWRAILGTAWLDITKLATDRNYWYGCFEHSKWDVIMGATVNVAQPDPRGYVWGASLWYTNRKSEQYRWWEVGYMDFPLLRSQRQCQPFALDSVTAADKAMGPGMAEMQEAYTPRPIDDEHTEDFVQRWIGLLVKAYHGELGYPRDLPLTWESL